jgi:hypothetical protein
MVGQFERQRLVLELEDDVPMNFVITIVERITPRAR